jgi:hypothetical protein
MLKAALRLEEPTWWKGGSMAEIFKNKGSSLDCTAFRDVMVSDAPASQYHAWIRALVNPYFEQGSRDTQFGSRKLRATAQAAHCVRGWLKLCRSRCSSGAVIFLDIISAFGEVMRELFLGAPNGRRTRSRVQKTRLESVGLQDLQGSGGQVLPGGPRAPPTRLGTA